VVHGAALEQPHHARLRLGQRNVPLQIVAPVAGPAQAAFVAQIPVDPREGR